MAWRAQDVKLAFNFNTAVPETDENFLYYQSFKEKFGEDVVIKKFEKTKGWLSQKLSSSNHIDQFANILDERSIWQRYGF